MRLSRRFVCVLATNLADFIIWTNFFFSSGVNRSFRFANSAKYWYAMGIGVRLWPSFGRKNQKESDKGKPPTIWPKFVEKCNELLKPDGVMVLVHPSMGRKPGHVLQKILYNNKNRQLI